MPVEWISLKALQTPILQQNLTYLAARNTELLELIQSSAGSEFLLFQKQGGFFLCKTNEPSPRWIFGGTNPRQEFEQISRELTNIPPGRELLVLLGNAAGYVLSMLIPRLLESRQLRILIIEPDAARIRACFALLDLRAGLETGRLHFAVSDPQLQNILATCEHFNLLGAKKPVLYIAPEMRYVRLDSFEQEYRRESNGWEIKRNKQIERLAKNHDTNLDFNRVLLIDCWPGAPGSAHIHAIHNALKKRGIESRIQTLNRYRIEAHEEEYRRLIEPSLSSSMASFRPQLVISYGYHAPKIIHREIYEASGITWLQVVSNIAYHDTRYFSNEHTALIEKGLIPYFQRRGAPHPFFVPLMADFVANQPTPTNRQIPIVFVGNSLGLSPQAVTEFFQLWSGRDELINYILKAEKALSHFELQENLYGYLNSNPIPQIQDESEEYAVFRYLLCQASAARRRYLLERITPFGLAIWGGDWRGYLPKESILNRCLKGPLPLQEEPKVFGYGAVFVNIQSIGHVTGPNMRFFNVPGMGGFQISDGNFSNYLEADEETVYYTTGDQLVEKVRYYLNHPGEMDEIRANGHTRILRDWTYDRWLDWISDEMSIPF